MADESTPRSDAASTGPKVPAPKDKSCPFCQQPFTSSSLGRHLDLYIKPRNPKAPDGVHNVEEIRRIRGGITRRQARNSLGQRESGSSTPRAASISSQAPPPQTTSEDASPTLPAYNPVPGGKLKVMFNEANWQATGVINNLPPRQSISSAQELRRDVSRHEQQKRDLGARQAMSEELDNARAADLALREVLNSLREASARTCNTGLFDFDPYALNFPSLCLQCLPAPTTLFSPTPFPTNESWSVNPPGQKQFEALNSHIRDRLMHRQRHQQLFPNNHMPGPSKPTSPLPTPPLFDPDPTRLFTHVQDAFTHWKSLPEKQRQEAWQLDILRSYIRADEARNEAESNLAAARREIESLKANRWINMGMASAGSPFSAQTSPGSGLHVSKETFKELYGKGGLDSRTWDYDRLMEKWRGVVRENRKAGQGLVSQRSLSTSSVPTTPGLVNNIHSPHGSSNMNPNGNNAANGSGMVMANSPTHMTHMNGTNTLPTATSALSQPSLAAHTFPVPSSLRDGPGMPDSDATEVMNGDASDADADADEVAEAPALTQAPSQQQHQQTQQRHGQRNSQPQHPQASHPQTWPMQGQTHHAPPHYGHGMSRMTASISGGTMRRKGPAVLTETSGSPSALMEGIETSDAFLSGTNGLSSGWG